MPGFGDAFDACRQVGRAAEREPFLTRTGRTHDHQTRVHSYELLAEVLGLERSAPAQASQATVGLFGEPHE